MKLPLWLILFVLVLILGALIGIDQGMRNIELRIQAIMERGVR